MIRLFTTCFPESNPVRAAEFTEALRRNVACSPIGEICVLAETEVPPVSRSAKLRVRKVQGRPMYEDYIRWINELATTDDFSVIANADIFFDDGLDVLRKTRMKSGTAFALSRWDVETNGKALLYDHNDSQDSWVFRGRVEGVRADFLIGVPRCDNRFMKELELAGYEVLNPSFSLRSFHLHAGSRATYPVEPEAVFVPPPYGYKWPHNLWPLYRTLLHNVTHPAARVSWRFDSRLWRRKLKVHWIERAVHTSIFRRKY
ncbi:MAG TPA: hypothetical protein VM939_11675 [Gemmatimonadaceae bacterium]|nr:hypothetical protein [Gemmatimonadaceae bacterium]